MDLPSPSHFPCALLQPSLFLADVPCPLLFSQDVSWLTSPDVHDCCPASSIMSDSSVAYFNNYFLAIIVGRQKSIFYLLLYVLKFLKNIKLKYCFSFWGFCAISHLCPSDVKVILGNGEAEGAAASGNSLDLRHCTKGNIATCPHNVGFSPAENLPC